jgi:hypothetical protein
MVSYVGGFWLLSNHSPAICIVGKRESSHAQSLSISSECFLEKYEEGGKRKKEGRKERKKEGKREK